MNLNEQLLAIQKSKAPLAEKKALCIKLGLRPRDVEYLEFSGFFNCECLTFGVEVECNVRRDDVIRFARCYPTFRFGYEGYNHTDNRHYYKFVTDGSVHGYSPIECVSPILEDSEDGFKSLETCLRVLNSAGASVNSSCGLHVHVGVEKLTVEEMVNIYKNYQKLEGLIDSFMAPSRRGDCRWAKSLQRICFDRVSSVDSLQARMSHDRYYKVNAMAYSRHKTVEFRQHQGTTDYKKIAKWVSFCCKLVEWSKRHVLESEVTSIADVPFLNDEEKAFFASRVEYFSTH